MQKDELKDEQLVTTFCDRLRQLRKLLNLSIEDVAEKAELSFAQVQRIEADLGAYRENIKEGGAGTASSIIRLLNYYSTFVDVDLLFNFKLPISEIMLNKNTQKEIAKEKLVGMIPLLKDIAESLG